MLFFGVFRIFVIFFFRLCVRCALHLRWCDQIVCVQRSCGALEQNGIMSRSLAWMAKHGNVEPTLAKMNTDSLHYENPDTSANCHLLAIARARARPTKLLQEKKRIQNKNYGKSEYLSRISKSLCVARAGVWKKPRWAQQNFSMVVKFSIFISTSFNSWKIHNRHRELTVVIGIRFPSILQMKTLEIDMIP